MAGEGPFGSLVCRDHPATYQPFHQASPFSPHRVRCSQLLIFNIPSFDKSSVKRKADAVLTSFTFEGAMDAIGLKGTLGLLVSIIIIFTLF